MIFLYFILFVLLFTFAYAGWRGAPWVPTQKKDLERFLKLADIKPGQKVYDLGCGDGRLLLAAAEAGGEARGFEISLLPFLLAQIKKYLHPRKSSVKISYKDIWRVDLSDADIVYFFLMPKAYPRLKEKFEKELKSGTKIIAYVWPMEGWTPSKIDKKEKSPDIFLYEKR